ncbi:hypothetical protein F8M41_006907 [Gigaspora margarita]|uniref:Uncharacterized protein n=1 Tax=Gigaspora margarita TaxID=4874 RepID=A0A8H3X6E0_GIGMA|nr:hypothetical protein F8M41_006907 [Gigaspora margarita]
MIAKDVKGLETYILFIEGATKAAAEDAFKNKNKLQNNELKNVYKIFDALSKSQFSFVKEIGNFYKGCFYHHSIGEYKKDKKKAIECFKIAANKDLTTKATTAKQQLTELKVPIENKIILYY